MLSWIAESSMRRRYARTAQDGASVGQQALAVPGELAAREPRVGLGGHGGRDVDACAADLWSAVAAAVEELSAELGDDPEGWITEADRTGFVPDLIPDTIRRTNRPTYQQVLEWLAPG